MAEPLAPRQSPRRRPSRRPQRRPWRWPRRLPWRWLRRRAGDCHRQCLAAPFRGIRTTRRRRPLRRREWEATASGTFIALHRHGPILDLGPIRRGTGLAEVPSAAPRRRIPRRIRIRIIRIQILSTAALRQIRKRSLRPRLSVVPPPRSLKSRPRRRLGPRSRRPQRQGRQPVSSGLHLGSSQLRKATLRPRGGRRKIARREERTIGKRWTARVGSRRAAAPRASAARPRRRRKRTRPPPKKRRRKRRRARQRKSQRPKAVVRRRQRRQRRQRRSIKRRRKQK
mmetsp:Transcript_56266/g.156721  ORF Transcript_56266/g.156721 Transcript_56266/m.156721 type:complete len:283 (+) Transcript_56266:888-1736(+)